MSLSIEPQCEFPSCHFVQTNTHSLIFLVYIDIYISGTNLQALIDHVQNPSDNSSAEIVLVISNKSGVKGLERAQAAGIQTKVHL